MSGYIYWGTYLIIINFISICATVSDKRRAQSQRWRVPEHTLLLFAALGGSPAMLITMLLIHHKTRHLKFMAGIPALMILQVTMLYFMIKVFL